MKETKKIKKAYTFYIGDKKVVLKATSKKEAIKLLSKISNE